MPTSAASERAIAILRLMGEFVGAAMLLSFQRADRPGDGGIKIGIGAGNDAGGEGRGVEFMLRIQNKRDMHGAVEGGARACPCRR